MTGHRNVLFIVMDQLRADVLTGALAGFAPTPNLDAFAASAIRFDNHFSVTSPCGPSRASLLTGLYAMNHRAIRNGTPLASHHTNLALEARKLGHEPLLFGYTDIQPDPTGRSPADPDNFVYENTLPGFREIVEMRLEYGAEWLGHLRAHGYDVPDAMSPNLMRLYRPEGGVFGNPALYAAEDSDTAYLTDRTIAALSVRKTNPFFAHVTYVRPHPPLVAPAPYHDLVDPATLPATGCGRARSRFCRGLVQRPEPKVTCSGISTAIAGRSMPKRPPGSEPPILVWSPRSITISGG